MPTPRNQSKGQAHAGFTMVELLVVISIIAVLAGLLMPAVIGAMRRAHETKTLNLIHQCETAVQTFYNDYGDYPPSTWAEVDDFFKVPNPNPADIGTGTGWDGGLFSDIPLTNGYRDPTTPLSTVNQGIEVFTFCLASRNGGPYLDFSNDMLGNTDKDIDTDDLDVDSTPDVLQATNYYFGGTQVFETVDFWGNPLVYIHNRDYMAHDGWNDNGTPADPSDDYFEPPPSTPPTWVIGDPLDPSWASSEAMPYVDSEGSLRPCYARSVQGFVTGNYPKLDSFQLYSWGSDLLPGCEESDAPAGTPDPSGPGPWPGWDKNSRNLTNWQE